MIEEMNEAIEETERLLWRLADRLCHIQRDEDGINTIFNGLMDSLNPPTESTEADWIPEPHGLISTAPTPPKVPALLLNAIYSVHLARSHQLDLASRLTLLMSANVAAGRLASEAKIAMPRWTKPPTAAALEEFHKEAMRRAGQQGGRAKASKAEPLKVLAYELYIQGDYPSINAGAEAIKDRILEESRKTGYPLTRTNAQRKIAVWISQELKRRTS